MKSNKNKEDRFFLICGGGNDQKTIQNFIEQEKPVNVKFMSQILPDDFDNLSRRNCVHTACSHILEINDVGRCCAGGCKSEHCRK